MRSFILFLTRSTAAFFSTVFVWLISFFGFDQSFFSSSCYAIAGGVAVYFLLKTLQKKQWLKQNGLTGREYKYISDNLKEAKQKISRLQRTLFKARSIETIQQLVEAVRLSKRIYRIAEKEPRRFYQGEQFFFYHLDSCVELAEKYTYLASQPIRDQNIRASLGETKRMLSHICSSLEKDLIAVLSDDIDHLQFELNVAKKQALERKER